MTPPEVGRELLEPLTNAVLLLATATFGGALWLTFVLMQRGPLFLVLGLVGLIMVASTLFRYAIRILECRLQGRAAPVADIDDLTPFTGTWTFFPLALGVAVLWAGVALQQAGAPAAGFAVLIVYVALLPASLAVLAITHSPLQSVNPLALKALIRRCGAGYLWIPLLAALQGAAIWLADRFELPLLAVVLAAIYVLFAIVGLTGAVVHRTGLAGNISIGAPAGPTETEYRDALAAERRKVANHAYGFISRGNREGGFRHIRERIATEDDADDAVAWFFNEMMRWERKDAALVFGQECLAHFLHHDNDVMALKVASRCLHEDAAWRPRREDRAHAIGLAEKYARDDLLPALRR